MIPTTSLSAAKEGARREARSLLGVSRLTPAQALDADRLAEAIFSAAESASKAAADARRLADAPRAAIARIIAAVYPLRQTTNGAIMTVDLGTPGLVATTARDWKSVGRRYNSGMGCIASHHAVRVPADWLETVHAPGLAVIDGILTLSVVSVPAPSDYIAWDATWARQGRGTGTEVEHGFLVRRQQGGDIVHALTIDAGIRLLGRRSAVIGVQHKPARRVTFALAARLGLCRTGSLAWAYRNLTAEEVDRGWVTPRRFREAVAAAEMDSPVLTARVLAAIE